MIGTSQLINAFGAPVCFTDTTDIFKDGSGVALYGLDYDASDTGGASGKFGEAAIFNGSSSKIVTTLNANGFSQIAISCWINTSLSSGTGSGHIVSANDGTNWCFLSIVKSTGIVTFGASNGGSSIFSATHTGAINDGNWHHIVGSYNGTNAILYIDGTGYTPVSATASLSVNVGFGIGYRNTGSPSGTYFNGSIDQVRVYNTALTQSQVTQLYQENSSTVGTHLFGCVANYNFDGNAKESMGTTAYDGTETDITYRYDGTPTAVDFGVGGKSNYGARFNGSSSRIQITSNATTPLNVSSGNFSISMWVNPSNLTNNNKLIYKWGTSASLNSWIATITTNGVLYVVEGTTAGDTLMLGTTTIPTNAWTHIAITRAQGGNLVQYINGVATNTFSTQNRSLKTSTEPLYIGYQAGQSTNFTGSIDQVRIFSKAINSDEVAQLYAETACVYTATTTDNDYPTTNLAYYKLDNSAEDEKGSYDGTETNIEYRFGRFGQAAMFKLNGSTSVFDTNVSVPTNWTVSLWLKRTPNGYFGGTTNSSVRSGVYFYANSNGKLSIYNRNSSGGNIDTLNTSTGLVTEGNWHHIAITFDSNSGTGLTTVYVDSANAGTLDGTPTHSTDFKFGRSGDYTSDTFNGSIDQLRIFSSALTSNQVTELYNEKPEVDTSNFKAVLYKGNSTTNYISNVGMDLETGGGLVWMKDRDTTFSHTLYDSIRGTGTGKAIFSDAATEEGNRTDIHNFVSFDANGFTVGVTTHANNIINKSGNDLVAWCWKAGGDAVAGTGTGVTSVSVSANTEAGFSIVKYTGGNSASDTVNHGLTDAEMIILKDLDDGSNNWRVWHKDLTTNYWLYLNLTNPQVSGATDGGIRNVNSNSFGFINGTTGGVEGVNSSASDYIAYVWKSISGYSKIGSYEGLGTSTVTVSDVGFKPSFIMIKNIDATANWNMYDLRRSTVADRANGLLYPNLANSEVSGSSIYYFDMNNSGFVVGASNHEQHNKAGRTYIYMAFK